MRHSAVQTGLYQHESIRLASEGVEMPRFRRRKLVLWISSIAALAVILGVGVGVHCFHESIHNSYSLWWVGDMVVLHLESNADQWPESWDDLHDDYETCSQRTNGHPWTFDEFRSRVAIDWDANPSEMSAMKPNADGDAPFRVVWLRDGSNSYWHGREPNRMIHRYLRGLPPDP